MREALAEGLKEAPQTFGTRLMIAHLSQNRAEAIHEAIAAHWITIPTAGETCQREIASMVTDTLGDDPADHADRIALWSEEAQAVHEWLASVRSGPNVAVFPIISF